MGGEGIIRGTDKKTCRNESLEDLSVDGRVTLKCAIGIGWERRNKFMCFKTGTSCESL